MSRLTRDDRGQITTALVVIITLAVVGLSLGVAKLGQATDQKSQAQSAADAAALAGAQQIRSDAPGLILAAINAGGGNPFACGLGRGAASDFANRGGAQVVQYCYSPGSDTVQVSVEGLVSGVAGSPAKAQAKAESRIGVALGDCVMPTLPTPPPTSVPTPAPTAPPTTPPPDVDADAHCGDLTIPVVFDGVSGLLRSALSASEIRDLFISTPALKS